MATSAFPKGEKAMKKIALALVAVFVVLFTFPQKAIGEVSKTVAISSNEGFLDLPVRLWLESPSMGEAVTVHRLNRIRAKRYEFAFPTSANIQASAWEIAIRAMLKRNAGVFVEVGRLDPPLIRLAGQWPEPPDRFVGQMFLHLHGTYQHIGFFFPFDTPFDELPSEMQAIISFEWQRRKLYLENGLGNLYDPHVRHPDSFESDAVAFGLFIPIIRDPSREATIPSAYIGFNVLAPVRGETKTIFGPSLVVTF